MALIFHVDMETLPQFGTCFALNAYRPEAEE
jgi:hypothetical protein